MANLIKHFPASDGFVMPGEFEPHKASWMIWPERPDNWRLNAEPAQQVFAKVAEAIASYEEMNILTSSSQFQKARAVLSDRVNVIEIASNDSWIRDTGPSFVRNPVGELRMVDWGFNAWGGLDEGLYYPWDKDEVIPETLSEILNIDRYKAPLVMEGGSFHVDGEGTCIVTEECLLNKNRNPKLTKQDIEQHLKDYLGAKKVIWLGAGVYNDETNGHVDNLLSFAAPGVILLTWTDDKADPQYERSLNALKRLESKTDAAGRPFVIHKLHQPGPLYITEKESAGVQPEEGTIPRSSGERMAGSYANFYIVNGAVIMPVFNDPKDSDAVDTLKNAFPNREIVPIYAREILLGGGNIHCITQQQPGERYE